MSKFFPLILLLVTSCQSIKVEIQEQVAMTALDKPGMILVESHPNYCIALLSLGLKETGGYKVSGVRFEDDAIFVQSDKPQGMVTMMLSTPGAKLKFTPCPKQNLEKIEVHLN